MLLRCAIQLPVGGEHWIELSAKDGGAVATRANCALCAPERTRPTEPLGLLLVEPDPLERAHLVDSVRAHGWCGTGDCRSVRRR